MLKPISILTLVLIGCFPVQESSPVLSEQMYIEEPEAQTMVIVSSEHWHLCCKLCGIKKVKSAGFDPVTKEGICTCTDRRRIRLEPLDWEL